MATKLVDTDQLDSQLTWIADSIRAKTGTEGTIYFPDGFISEIDSIETPDDMLAELENIEYIFSNGFSDYSNMFKEKYYMTEVPVGILQNTANGTNFANMFYFGGLCTEMPQFDVSNGKDFSHMFYGMADVETFPSFNTAEGLNFDGMFGMCMNTKTIEGIDLSSATSVNLMFDLCSALENITFNGTIKASGLDFSATDFLTYESLMSAINALYDWASEGSTETYYLKTGITNMGGITEADIAIATQKGWTITV